MIYKLEAFKLAQVHCSCVLPEFQELACFQEMSLQKTFGISKKLTLHPPSACLDRKIGRAIYENHMLFKERTCSLIPETTIFNIISKLATEDKVPGVEAACCRWFLILRNFL